MPKSPQDSFSKNAGRAKSFAEQSAEYRQNILDGAAAADLITAEAQRLRQEVGQMRQEVSRAPDRNAPGAVKPR